VARGSRLRPLPPSHCVPLGPPIVFDGETARTVRLSLDCGARGLAGARVAVEGLAASGTDVLVHVVHGDGSAVRLLLSASRPWLSIPAREGAADVLARFASLGARHLATGLDHALFLLGLVVLVRGGRALVGAVSAFTVGHSATLVGAAAGGLHVPAEWAELAVAASLVLLARALAAPPGTPPSRLARRPALASGAFGLVHGLGFAGTLAEAGLPPGAVPLALAGFNLGIELAQLALVAAFLAAGAALAPLARAAGGGLARLARELPAVTVGAAGVFFVLSRLAP